MRSIAICAILLVLVLGASEVEVTEAVTCNPLQLSPCATAITSSNTSPSPVCCSKLKEQRPCLCKYMKDPRLQKFIASPNAKKVANTCGSPFPRC
nr:Non-specific lipid-transfer protein 2 [Ipomoea batatas]